jgi:hypothetical protein
LIDLLEYKPLNAARECGVTFFSNTIYLSWCKASTYSGTREAGEAGCLYIPAFDQETVIMPQAAERVIT